MSEKLNYMYFMYTIYDRIAEEASPPFCARNSGMAIRYAKNLLKESDINDFLLYKVGTFDPFTITVAGLETATVPWNEVSNGL